MSDKRKFIGEVKTEWLHNKNDDRLMKLLEDFKYIDSKGKEWLAPAGFITDGASIPRFFWRLMSSPFVGDYRRAAILHDIESKNKNYSQKEIHNLFYEMMVADGVSKFKAWLMHQSVYWYNKFAQPSWK